MKSSVKNSIKNFRNIRKMKGQKGQLSYIIKPLSLVMTIVLLLILYNSIQNFGNRERQAQQGLDLTADATNILLVLANSEDCLAYRSAVTRGLYANIVDVTKLNSFAAKYSDSEPECARSLDFGWRVTVIEFKRSAGTTIEGSKWSFGANEFSRDSAFRNSLDFSIPVAIRYSDKLTRAGMMQVHLVDGELEKISGMLDWYCEMFKSNRFTKGSAQIMTSYPLSFNTTDGELCSMSKEKSCRKMWCPMDFEEIKSGGTYILKMNYADGAMVVKS